MTPGTMTILASGTGYEVSLRDDHAAPTNLAMGSTNDTIRAIEREMCTHVRPASTSLIIQDSGHR